MTKSDLKPLEEAVCENGDIMEDLVLPCKHAYLLGMNCQ